MLTRQYKVAKMATVPFQADTSRRLIRQAAAYLAKGDGLQASDKGWSAAAHAVKAIADARGWRHTEIADLFKVASRLADETGQPYLLVIFSTASALHTNFYEDWFDDDVIAQNLASVRRLLDMLDELPH